MDLMDVILVGMLMARYTIILVVLLDSTKWLLR